jgi:hypothetical protein
MMTSHRPWRTFDFPSDNATFDNCCVKSHEDFPRHIHRLFKALGAVRGAQRAAEYAGAKVIRASNEKGDRRGSVMQEKEGKNHPHPSSSTSGVHDIDSLRRENELQILRIVASGFVGL